MPSGAIHDMAQTGRSNARYVDPQRRYTVVLGPSWNAPFEALPHDDRAGTHDSADGRCGSYASIGSGQAALWIRSKNFCRSDLRQLLRCVVYASRYQYVAPKPCLSCSHAVVKRRLSYAAKQRRKASIVMPCLRALTPP